MVLDIKHLFIMVMMCVASVGCSQVKEYYSDGVLFVEYETNAEGNKHGSYKEYFVSGQLYVECNYSNDTLDSDCIAYYKTGKLHYHIKFQHGLLYSVFEYNDKDGNSLDYGNFKNGNGEINVYNLNGKLRDTGAYKDGLKDGYWYIYSNKGLMDSVMYKKGISESGTAPQLLPPFY